MHLSIAISLPLVVALSVSAQAHHKPGHPIPPGQLKKMTEEQIGTLYDPAVVIPAEVEFVCLVTTDRDGDPYAPVSFTQWLPRTQAEAEADKGQSFVIYHPDLNTEKGCTGF